MGRKSNTGILYCSMNGHLVGELRLTNGRLSFQYDKIWLDIPGGRAISLSLPLQAEEITGDEVARYFDNLLPDNNSIRQRIVDRLGAKSISPFDLLAQIGGDCIGALALELVPPARGSLHSSLLLSLTPLSESQIAQQIRDSRSKNTLGMDSNDDFRISLAGAQEKTALTFWENAWCKPHGRAPTTHIFKPPIYHHESMGIDLSDSVDNEWFCLRFLQHLDIPTANADIKQFEDQKVLVVERFDRKISDKHILRLPQEDMCQALGRSGGSKYEDHGGPGALEITNLLKLSKHTVEDRQIFFKAQIAFWLLAAIDGHGKNFSIFHQPNGYCLTPLYDVMSAFPYFGQGNIQKHKIKMAMKVHSKNTHYHWNNIQKRHWYTHGKRSGFSDNAIDSMMTYLTDRVEKALTATKDEAPELFNHKTGNLIADRVRQSVLRLTS